MATTPQTFTWDDQEQKPPEQAGGFKWDDSSAPAAAAPAQPVQPGFLESLGHTFGVGKEEAETRRQNLDQHPVRTILEDQPPVQAAEGLYQGGKRILGEVGQAIQAGREGNPYGAAQHAIQAVPFVGAGIQRGAEQLPAQPGIQNPLQPGVLGTVAGTAAQAAPLALGGWEGLKAARAARLRGAPAATRPPAPAVPADTANVDTIEALDSLARAGKDAHPTPAVVAPVTPAVPEEVAPTSSPAAAQPGPPAKPLPSAEQIMQGLREPPRDTGEVIHAGPPPQPEVPATPQAYAERSATPLLDDLVERMSKQVSDKSPDEISALRDAIDETGRRAHESGDTQKMEAAADAHAALSQLLEDAVNNTKARDAGLAPKQAENLGAAEAALTGKPMEEVAAARGFKWDDQKPAETTKQVSPEDVARALETVGAAGRPVVQASSNPEQIQQSAEEQKPALKEMAAAAVAGVPGAKVEGARVKDAESVANKDDRGKPPETITDHLGGRVSAPTPEAVQQVKQNIEQSLPVVGKDQIDNNGLNATQYAVQTGKPGDANQQSELQVVTTDQAKAMKDTDPLYEKQKEALARGDQKEADRLGAQIKEHFDAAQPEGQPAPAPLPDVIPKGTRVQLQDGRTGTVQWYDRTKQVARVKRDDGKEMPMVPRKALQAAPAAHVDAGPIGNPIPSRIKQIKDLVAKGTDVRIFSARVANDPEGKVRAELEQWSEKNLGAKLPITNAKDDDLAHILDDKANVTPNTNEPFQIPPIPKGKWLAVDLDKTLAYTTTHEPRVDFKNVGNQKEEVRQRGVEAVEPRGQEAPGGSAKNGKNPQGELRQEEHREQVSTREVHPREDGERVGGRAQGGDGEASGEEVGDGRARPSQEPRPNGQPLGKSGSDTTFPTREATRKGAGSSTPVQVSANEGGSVVPESQTVRDVQQDEDKARSQGDVRELLRKDEEKRKEKGVANAQSGNGGQPSAATAPKGEGGETNAIQKPSAARVLQREPEQDRSEGSGRVQPEQQGNGPAGESTAAGPGKEEAKPLGGAHGEQGSQGHAADEVKPGEPIHGKDLAAGMRVRVTKIPPGSYLTAGEEYTIPVVSKSGTVQFKRDGGAGTMESRGAVRHGEYTLLARPPEKKPKTFAEAVKAKKAKAKSNTLPGLSGTEHIQSNTPTLQGGPDRGVMESEGLRNALHAIAASDKSLREFDIPSQRLVMDYVISQLHDHEIRDAVVKFVPIDVVNNLARLQASAKVSLHDKPMLGNTPSVDLENPISIRMDTADRLVSAIAKAAAKNIGGPSPMGALPKNGDAALSAGVGIHEATIGESKEHVKPNVPPRYAYGNTQADIPPSSDAGKALAELRDSIDPADLMGDGLEKDAHVTVRYGIQGDDTAGIKAFIEQQAPFDATLGPVAKFPPSEHSDGAAPLIAPVESPDLHKLNAEIEKHGDFTEPSFPEYKPHATVAYVKPEAADKYVGDTTTEGATFRVDSIDITDRDGNAETVALKGTAPLFSPGQPVRISGEGFQDARGNAVRDDEGTIKKFTPAEENHGFNTAVIIRPDGNETRVSWAEGRESPLRAWEEGKAPPRKAAPSPAEKAKVRGELAELERKREEVRQQYEKVGYYYSEGGKELSNQNVELTKQIFAKEDELAKLNGEPTRDERKAMQEQAATTPFDQRPAQAMKYDQPQQSQHWQVMEPDYANRRFESQVAQYERAVKSDAAEVENAKPGTKAYDKAKAALDWRRAILKRLKDQDDKIAQQYKHEYLELVKKAISKGSPVPDSVIAQYSEFRTALDARERYEKGRHTSFANRSAAINDTMQKEEGFKAKRQDGKAITDAQVKEIKDGIADIATVLGADLRDMMRGTDLTIAHTNGKHPFLSDAGGMYHPGEKSISAGIDNWLGQPVRALAHEVGHWFDYESGKVMGAETKITRGGKRVATAYASEADADKLRYAGYGTRAESLYSQALKTMTDTREVTRMLKVTKLSDLDPEARSQVERTKVVLGHYWREPREIFARLFEQYISEKLGRGGLASETPELYHTTPGWWDKDAWAKLEPMVEAEVNKRLTAMRERYAPKAQEAAPAAASAASKIETPLDKFEGEGKSPYEITQKEWVELQRAHRRALRQSEDSGTRYAPNGDYESYHEESVKTALRMGLSVPGEVLKDYPNLQAPSAPAAEPKPTPKPKDWASTVKAKKAAATPRAKVEVTPEGVTKQEGVEEKPVPKNAIQLEPPEEVPQKGKNFEGRYLQAALEPAKNKWDQLLTNAPEVGFSDPVTRNGKKEITARTNEENYQDRKVLTLRQHGDSWSIVYQDYSTPKGSKQPVEVHQVVVGGLTLRAAKEIAEARLQTGDLYDPAKPFYNGINREVDFEPDIERKMPDGLDAEKLVVQIPNDGRFTIPNNPAAIEGAIKKANNFVPEGPERVGTRPPKAPSEFDNAKYVQNLQRQIEEHETDLKHAQKNPSLHGQVAYHEEELKALRLNLEEAKNPPKASDLGTVYSGGFLDPALFKRLFPDIAERTAQWAGDTKTPGDDQRAMMRETRGQMDRRVAIAIFKLRGAAKEWRTRPRAESIEFWNAVENGRIGSLSPKDQALAQVFKAAFDQMRGDLQKLKPEALQNYIENYFPHIWERSSQVTSTIKGMLNGKKPFAGKGGFLKRRTIPTMQDGLDLGFVPKSWNPVDLFVLKYAEMAQFLMGHQTLEVMKESGTAKFVRIGQKAPEGFTQLDDKIATVYRRVKVLDDDKLDDVTQPLTYPGGKRKIPGAFSEDIEDATHGELALVGHYYAPADAARVFNNFVSRGIAGRSSIYDTLRWLNDNLNGLQLGISAFHATVTTVNAAASDIALGIEQLMQGKPVKAGASMVSGAAILPTLYRTIRNGSKLMREYLSPGSHAKMTKEADAIAEAGGRVKQNTIELKPFDKAINAFRNGAFFEGLSAVPGAILQGMVAPVLDYYVPRMKVGAFYYMAHNILDEAQRKNWTPELTRTRLQEAWDSIDDRFGQVVYDNLFWHKGLRDTLHLAVRAVGYTYGDIRTYGGAVKDTAKAAVQVGRGKKPRVTPRMAFAVGSFISTALLGGVMTMAWTGHAPQTWKDYTHPMDNTGQRHTIPGYPDQMISAGHDPIQWALNKQAPIWSLMAEAARNSDFNGTEIRHKDDPAIQQLAEVAEWAIKQPIPFSFSNTGKLLEDRGAMPTLASMLHEAEEHPGDIALGNLGFTPAPSFVQHSEALSKAYTYERENRPAGTKTKEQAEKQQAMHSLRSMFASGKVDRQKIAALKAQGIVNERDLLKARLTAKTDPLVRVVKSLTPEQALNVWNVADAKERKELRSTIEEKSRDVYTKVGNPEKRRELQAKYRGALRPTVQVRPGSA